MHTTWVAVVVGLRWDSLDEFSFSFLYIHVQNFGKEGIVHISAVLMAQQSILSIIPSTCPSRRHISCPLILTVVHICTMNKYAKRDRAGTTLEKDEMKLSESTPSFCVARPITKDPTEPLKRQKGHS